MQIRNWNAGGVPSAFHPGFPAPTCDQCSIHVCPNRCMTCIQQNSKTYLSLPAPPCSDRQGAWITEFVCLCHPILQRAQRQEPAAPSSEGEQSFSTGAESPHSRGPAASNSSSGSNKDSTEEACSTSNTSNRSGSSSSRLWGRSKEGMRGWWAWLRGRGRQSNAGEALGSSRNVSSSHAEQGKKKGDSEQGSDDDDESGFQEWLDSQTLSKDGLVAHASG